METQTGSPGGRIPGSGNGSQSPRRKMALKDATIEEQDATIETLAQQLQEAKARIRELDSREADRQGEHEASASSSSTRTKTKSSRERWDFPPALGQYIARPYDEDRDNAGVQEGEEGEVRPQRVPLGTASSPIEEEPTVLTESTRPEMISTACSPISLVEEADADATVLHEGKWDGGASSIIRTPSTRWGVRSGGTVLLDRCIWR